MGSSDRTPLLPGATLGAEPSPSGSSDSVPEIVGPSRPGSSAGSNPGGPGGSLADAVAAKVSDLAATEKGSDLSTSSSSSSKRRRSSSSKSTKPPRDSTGNPGVASTPPLASAESSPRKRPESRGGRRRPSSRSGRPQSRAGLPRHESSGDFSSPRVPEVKHDERLQHIENLKNQFNELTVPAEEDLLKSFRDSVKDDVLVIGEISLEEAEEQERALQAEREEVRRIESERKTRAAEAIKLRETQARGRVVEQYSTLHGEAQGREVARRRHEQHLFSEMQNAFNRAEEHLTATVASQAAHVREQYGDLEEGEGYYGGVGGRRWRVDWNRAPQPVEIRVQMLRGLRDRVPGGRYVIMASLYDRLGGVPLRWSKMVGNEWGGATLSSRHKGGPHDLELPFQQSLYTVCPAQMDILPSMVFVFELFLLKGSASRTDRVMGWGVFPVCDWKFDLAAGSFKLPMMRGPMDPSVTTHEGIQRSLATNLDNWLGNLYIDLKPMPRYVAGQRENEVELVFTSKLLGYPDRGDESGDDGPIRSATNASNLLPPESTSFVEAAAPPGTMVVARNTYVAKDLAAEKEEEEGEEADDSVGLLSGDAGRKGKQKSSSYASRFSTVLRSIVRKDPRNQSSNLGDGPGLINDLPHGKGGAVNLAEADEMAAIEAGGGVVADVDSDGEERNGGPDARKRAHFKKGLTRADHLQQYSPSVLGATSGHQRLRGERLDRLKASYVRKQLKSELGFGNWRSVEWWATMLLFIAVFYIRLYIHYGAQYVYLLSIRVPVSLFEFKAWTVDLQYNGSALRTSVEVGVVAIGVIGNVLVMAGCVGVSMLSQSILGRVADSWSRLVLAVSLGTILDAPFILLVDLITRNWEGDAFKLYQRFLEKESNGVSGIFVTAFVYAFLLLCAVALFYHYMLRVHLNGRMMDVYKRLHAPESSIFLPYDVEISLAELRWVTEKAERWRGAGGERRKVLVHEYVLRDPDAGREWAEKTTHLAVYTLRLNGSRAIFRHFLKLPDGAITEVFGDMESVDSRVYGSLVSVVAAALEQRKASAVADGMEGEPTGAPAGIVAMPTSVQDFLKGEFDTATRNRNHDLLEAAKRPPTPPEVDMSFLDADSSEESDV